MDPIGQTQANELEVDGSIPLEMQPSVFFVVPDTWDPPIQGNDPYNVRLVEIDSSCLECIHVAAIFSETCPSEILRVQRVQNLGLWELFQTKRRVMEQTSVGPNEMQLFHGTSSKNLSLINTNSFDRDYRQTRSSKQGVYFSTSAMYSASVNFSKPDPSGLQHMYLSRVLLGASQAATGTSACPDPPFDSFCNDPSARSIFVICNDSQAYPEYLITFISKQQDRPTKLSHIMSKAKAFAFADRFQIAMNHIGNGMAICAADAARHAGHALDLDALSEAVVRMISRLQDPRDWTAQDATDYLRCATGRLDLILPPRQPPDGNGADLILCWLKLERSSGSARTPRPLFHIIEGDIATRLEQADRPSPSPRPAPVALPEPPPHWTKPRDCAGPPPDYLLVDLTRTDPEYGRVEAAFATTCACKIEGVTRVENPGLWALFQSRLRAMARADGTGPRELRLFHGTSSRNLPRIHARGFSRSIDGPGGPGRKEVRFTASADAACAAGTAPPDARGRLHVYLARVLVSGHGPAAGEAEEWKVRAEAQAYPEYLVTLGKAAHPRTAQVGAVGEAAVTCRQQ
jgi:hypothetical protein